MNIHFIRHTSPAIDAGICYGQADISVAKSFDQEANDVLRCLEQQANAGQYDHIFSSPLTRCHQLALAIQAQQSNTTPLSINTDLLEVNFGDWELRAWKDIPKTESEPWTEDFIEARPPNGESLLDLQKRVQNFLTMLFDLNIENVAVCTHAGVMRLIAAEFLDIPLENIFTLKLSYGQVLALNKHQQNCTLQFL